MQSAQPASIARLEFREVGDRLRLASSQPITKPNPDVVGEFELIEAFDLGFSEDGIEKRLRFPSGISFDFASIPRAFWTLVGCPGDPRFQAPSLVHDFFYVFCGRLPLGSLQEKQEGSWIDVDEVYSRKRVDEFFFEHLKAAGVSAWKRSLMWAAVRLRGGSYWKNNHGKYRTWKDLKP